MRLLWFGSVSLLVASFFGLLGCGGGSTQTSNPPPPPPPTVTSVAATCASTILPVSQIVQCDAKVSGTGNFNSAVSWSVNNIGGGNATTGTITPSGVYTAPTAVPTPFTATVTATSVGDSTKNSSVSIIIAGVISSTSQTISAANGGTITLTDGSSVTFAAGSIATDQTITLTEFSYLPTPPPNSALDNVGPVLVVSFSTPVVFHTKYPVRAQRLQQPGWRASSTSSTQVLQFQINTANNPSALLSSSSAITAFTDTSSNATFTGTFGNYNSTTGFVSASIGADLLSGFPPGTIARIQLAWTNISHLGGILPLVPGAMALPTGSQTWVAYSQCPAPGRVLLLVHGMLSSVESSFAPATARQIQNLPTPPYDSIVGFDYDWLMGVHSNGTLLANFVGTLATCSGVTALDIEAHSEGVAVSLDALSDLAQNPPAHPISIVHMISLGGPIMGTPAANDPRIMAGYIASYPAPTIVKSAVQLGLAGVLAAPFLRDLEVSIPGDRSTLDLARSALASPSQANTPQIIPVAGGAPVLLGTLSEAWAAPLMGTSNFDGIIPVVSALAFQSATPPPSSTTMVYPLTPFLQLGHNDLIANPGVISAVAAQVENTRTPPRVTCASSLGNCEGTQNSAFTFAGAGYASSTTPSVQLSALNAAGAVTVVQTAQPTNSGGINWQTIPGCGSTTGALSVFSFDTTTGLAGNNVMQVVFPVSCATGPAGIIKTIAGNNQPGYTGDNGPATAATLYEPRGVAFDSFGNMFIADQFSNVIRKVDTGGMITTVAGTGQQGYSGDGAAATAATLRNPSDVVCDSKGNVYVADFLNLVIRKVDSAGIISTVAGNGLPPFSSIGDGGPATSASMISPARIAVDSAGNLYIADGSLQRIRVVNMQSTTINVASISIQPGYIFTVAGSGQAGFSGDNGPATSAALSEPSGVAVDQNGNIFIADSLNHRIRRVDAVTGIITTVAGSGVGFTSGDGGPALSAFLNVPVAVAVDSNGNLYFSDTGFDRIRAVNMTSSPATLLGVSIQPGNIDAVAGNGFSGYTGDGGPAVGAKISGPDGLRFDGFGSLYFADVSNNVVRQVSGP